MNNALNHTGNNWLYDKSECVVRLLKEKKLTLSCAESITGGMFSKCITDIPGASEVFDRGFVTYSNAAKESVLGVNKKTLDAFGAISEETAYEMAEGLKKCSDADICIAVTGNAGPYPAESKEVGEYYVSLCYNDKITVRKFKSEYNTRNEIREDACLQMLCMLSEIIY